ncbi:hypothetical protein EDB80DRAFT_204261 [Ilyonectria destructans]|nr:hypothetical protein EDB80DRAFT_204261 [Ilyonectria destructans]
MSGSFCVALIPTVLVFDLFHPRRRETMLRRHPRHPLARWIASSLKSPPELHPQRRARPPQDTVGITRVWIALPRKRLCSTPTVLENHHLYAYVPRQLPPIPFRSTTTAHFITATVGRTRMTPDSKASAMSGVSGHGLQFWGITTKASMGHGRAEPVGGGWIRVNQAGVGRSMVFRSLCQTRRASKGGCKWSFGFVWRGVGVVCYTKIGGIAQAIVNYEQRCHPLNNALLDAPKESKNQLHFAGTNDRCGDPEGPRSRAS